MRTQLLILLSFLAFSTSAQNNKFRFGAVISPHLSDNLLSNDGSVPKEVAGIFKQIENKTFGYHGYLFTHYAVNTKWNLRVGAGYARTGYILDKRKLIYAQSEPAAPEYAAFSWLHQDVSIPILLKYIPIIEN